jgi:hypothetical protein
LNAHRAAGTSAFGRHPAKFQKINLRRLNKKFIKKEYYNSMHKCRRCRAMLKRKNVKWFNELFLIIYTFFNFKHRALLGDRVR